MKVLSRIMYGIFGLVLILSAALFLAPSVPYLGHLEVKIVKSGSMEPSIKTGGIVVVREATSYREGDIITFTGSGSNIPTTHRIIASEEKNGRTEFVTKGDANEERDTETVPESSVLGKVLFAIPYLGFILDFARQPLGFVLLIGTPALLIVLDEVEKIWQELGRIRRKKMGDLRDAIRPLIVAPYVPPRFRVRMMDINRPIMVASEPFESERAPAAKREIRPPLRSQAHWTMAAGSSLLICALLIGLSTVGSTVSYFSDSELSLANALAAGTLDFTATVTSPTTAFNFVDGFLQNSDGTLTIDIELEPGSAPVLYDLTVATSGDAVLCDAILVDSGSPHEYAGPITGLSDNPIAFSGSWSLLIDLNEGGGYTSGQKCTLEMAFSGWNAKYPLPTSGRYEDFETITLTFTALETVPTAAPLQLQLEDAATTDSIESIDTEEEEKGNNGTPNHGEPVREDGKGSDKAQEVLNELHGDTDMNMPTESEETDTSMSIENEHEETQEAVAEPESESESEPGEEHSEEIPEPEEDRETPQEQAEETLQVV